MEATQEMTATPLEFPCGPGFRAVPEVAVTLNGTYFRQIFQELAAYRGCWNLIADRNNRAVDSESDRPYRYATLEAALEDASRLARGGDFSTCT